MLKIKNLLMALLLIGCLGVALPVYSGEYLTYRPNAQRIREKIIEYNQPLKIIGIPVAETNSEYYYKKSAINEGRLSDEEIDRIADAIVAKLKKDLGDSPDNEANFNELETNFSALVKTKCAACHNPEQHGGNLGFVDADGKFKLEDYSEDGSATQAEIAGLMFDAVFEQRMPKDKEKLSDQDTDLFRKYQSFVLKRDRKKGK